MKVKHWIIVMFIAALFSATAFYMAKSASVQKTAFIDINNVIQEFDMKKELEKDYLNIEKKVTVFLDSLDRDMKFFYGNIKDPSNMTPKELEILQGKREYYLDVDKQYKTELKGISNQYDEQILNQLNQYVKDYGDEFGYDFIFGNNGTGSVMYSSNTNNLTKEIIEYINIKYKGY